MTRRCILHFGMHKTGSSSIQKSLFNNRTELPWTYLNSGVPNSTLALRAMFSTSQVHNKRIFKTAKEAAKVQQRRKPELFQRMESQIAATDKDLLLSAEGMSVLGEEALKRLVDWVGQYVDEVVAVGYMRPPKAYMESAFQQILKNGGKRFDLKAVYPNYRKKFEKFENLLGRDKVQYWLFDPGSFPNGCVVRDFAARLGVTLEDGDVQRVNEGISMEALALLYAYNKYGKGHGVGISAVREQEMLVKKLAELKGHKLRFSPDLVRPILEEHREDIAWMEERLGRPFNEDRQTHAEFEVSDEAGMLRFGEASLATLREWTGDSSATVSAAPADVALLVGQLRRKLALEHKKPAALLGMARDW